jgi:ABC-type polysaccharide/polyol phosphate transport system ATPase subunit
MQNSSNPTNNPVKAIECKNVGVYYPSNNSIFSSKSDKEGYWALQDVTFDLNRGDILGVVGANGAGKSTILAVISNIIVPDRGSINTFDHSSMLLSINAGFSSGLSGRKNIYLIGLTVGISKTFIDEKIDEIIAFTDIGQFIDKPVQTYSTGMRTRLGFSTALFLEPEILLIDEALGVGDKNFKKKSSDALKKKLSKNTTAIIVSHSEATIKEICNRAVLLEKGRNTAFGTPDEVFNVYNSR